jgi:hypothetical protein
MQPPPSEPDPDLAGWDCAAGRTIHGPLPFRGVDFATPCPNPVSQVCHVDGTDETFGLCSIHAAVLMDYMLLGIVDD